jgi:proteasome accessory factor B
MGCCLHEPVDRAVPADSDRSPVNRTDRMFAIVEELRARAPATVRAADLAARFEMSVRTIERDLSALAQAGIPLWAQPGPGGGYAVDPDTTLPPLNLTPAEATAIASALAAGGSGPFAEAGRRALSKIAAVMSAGQLTAADALGERIRVARPAGAASTDPEVARAIEASLRENLALEIDYVDGAAATTHRVVEPSGLLSARGGWYLFGWCRLRDGGRGFRVDRIASAAVTTEPIDPHPLDELLRDVPLDVRQPALRADMRRRHSTRHEEA